MGLVRDETGSRAEPGWKRRERSEIRTPCDLVAL